MKKLLLGTAAIALGMSLAAPAHADGIDLGIGGYFKGYVSWLDQDEPGNDPDTAATETSTDVRSLDILRDTEIHFTGETTLDNGLTVGFHTETHADDSGSAFAGGLNGAGGSIGADSFQVEESYAYFSGAWGRVNFGAEDGVAYLLQVAAPSADSNLDGLRQYVNPVNHGALGTISTAADTIRFWGAVNGIFTGGFAAATVVSDGGAAGLSAGDTVAGLNGPAIGAMSVNLDYDHADSGSENKLTYLSPVFSGFQGGLSYTPELGGNAGVAGLAGHSLDGGGPGADAGDMGDIWELAARWEGMFGDLGMAFGGGWSHTDLDNDVAVGAPGNVVLFTDNDATGTFTAGDAVLATQDDRESWNIGADLNWGAFGLGAVYLQDDNGFSDNLDTDTFVVGLDYTTGPFKIGASYLDREQEYGPAELDSDRWTGGVVYTYGPGMTFRGSVSYVDYEEDLGARIAASSSSSEAEATSVMFGTQLDF